MMNVPMTNKTNKVQTISGASDASIKCITKNSIARSSRPVAINKFHKIDNHETVKKIIGSLENRTLIVDIVSKNGNTYRNASLIESNQETLTIEKPPDLGEIQTECVRIYFQENPKTWILLETPIIRESTYTYILERPRILYQYQTRNFQRMSPPEYSTAFYTKDGRVHYGGLVKDISVAGMLLCAGVKERVLSTDSTLENISILLHDCPADENGNSNKQSCLYTINKGKIVHSYRDPVNHDIYYGISFVDEFIATLPEKLEAINTSNN